MSGIVCALRGGPDSRSTIDRSIALASETGLQLYFLYVVNLDFLSRTMSSRVQSITAEMRQMGEFILLSAQAQAAVRSVLAQGVVRQGNVADEIIALCRELKAEYVVLGRPHTQREENIFSNPQLTEFGERIAREAGAKTIFVGGEKA